MDVKDLWNPQWEKRKTMVKNTKAAKRKAAVTTPDTQASISKRGYSAQKAKEDTVSSRKYPQDFNSTSISIQEKVALLAYSYWEKRGRAGGSPDEDWYRAEREIQG